MVSREACFFLFRDFDLVLACRITAGTKTRCFWSRCFPTGHPELPMRPWPFFWLKTTPGATRGLLNAELGLPKSS